MSNKITIGILAVISLASIVYAFVQKTEAAKSRELAEDNLILAEKSMHEAETNLTRAQKAEAMAKVNAKLASAKKKEFDDHVAKCGCRK